MNNKPLLGGVTDRLLALPKATFRDPAAVELLEEDLRSIENEYHRYDGFITYVKILIQESSFIPAERVIRSCADFSELDRAELLAKLGFQIWMNREKASGMKKLREAGELLMQLDGTGWSRGERLVEIARYYIALDESQLALELMKNARSICQEGLQQGLEANDPQDTHDSVSVLGDVGRVFVRLGMTEQAHEIADFLPNGTWRNYYLSILESRIDELP